MASETSRNSETGETEAQPRRKTSDPLAAEQRRRVRLAKAAPLIDIRADAKATAKATKTKRGAKQSPIGAWCKSRFGRSTLIATVSHAVLIVVLGLATVGVQRHAETIGLIASSEQTEPFIAESLTSPIPLETEPIDQLLEVLESDTSLASAIEPFASSVDALKDAPTPSSLTASDLAGLLAPIGEPSTTKDAGGAPSAPKPPPKTTTRFLGSSSTGQRFAFVIDQSLSMKQKGKFDIARSEMFRAVSMMKPINQFYVVFFGDKLHAIFDPEVENDMVAASPANQKRLYDWLSKLEPSSGTTATDGVELCAKLKPDVIYLLTDGEFRGSQVEDISRICKEKKIPVNTIGLKTPAAAEAGLRTIAQNTGGAWIIVP